MKLPPIRWPKCNAAQFAEICGVSPQAVTAWIDAGMPCERGRGKGHAVTVTLAKALPWVLARREPAGSQRERLAKEQADKIALENTTKRGELIYAGHVAEVLSAMSADLAARHDAVPGRTASEFAGINEPAVIRARLLDELRGVRGAFADAITKLADALGDPADDGGDPEAAAETDGDAVGRRKPRAAARKRRARAVAKR
jgi:phage terminase Nu1 subunit (DNA packaging protein)